MISPSSGFLLGFPWTAQQHRLKIPLTVLWFCHFILWFFFENSLEIYAQWRKQHGLWTNPGFKSPLFWSKLSFTSWKKELRLKQTLFIAIIRRRKVDPIKNSDAKSITPSNNQHVWKTVENNKRNKIVKAFDALCKVCSAWRIGAEGDPVMGAGFIHQ